MTDDRQAMERALRAEEARFRITLSSIGDGVISTDLQGRVMFLNPVAEALTGWTCADALGHDVAEVVRLVHGDTREPLVDPATRALAEGNPVVLPHPALLVARDGTERPVDDSASPIRDTNGDVVGAVLVFRDTTERRRADETLARLAAIVDSSDDAIVSKTLDGVIRSWNAGAERLFGYAPAEAIGRPITLIIPPELIEEERGILARLRRGERIDHFETTRVRKDGSRVEISLTVSPVRDPDGRIVGASKIARDITRQKELERRLEAQIHELAAANLQKERFVAMLAHELRNPLAPVKMAVEVMRLAAGDPVRITAAREMIDRHVQHLVRLLDDLLDASRLNRDRLSLEIRRVRLADVVRDAVEIVQPLVERAGHALTVRVPPDLELEADPTRLAQVLGNLLSNSAKYADPGTRIELVAEDAGREIVLRVRDEGHGIAPAVLPNVFDAFARAGRDDGSGGLGLGLSLVKGLVALHGGTVQAESEGTGKGCTFTVRVPRTQHETPAAPPPPAPASRAGRIRVLVVDDNKDAADTVATVLEMLEHEPHVAYTGAQALAVAARVRPHLVLMDLGMPGLDGVETTRRLRAEPWGASMRIVALTGWGSEADRRITRDAGFDGHLVKPASLEQIQDLLGEFAGG